MDSEPGSPNSSSSSGTLPDEPTYSSQMGDSIASIFHAVTSPIKRPFASGGTGPFGSHNVRDTKARRRDGRDFMKDDAPRRGGWGSRDDLVDTPLVDQLRAQFGDPFDDSIVKNAER
ncbi:hypothetical protein BKA93DRAFT_813607 [Sparassis latifolia]|uniref:Uncharacterized protein n=1 Tax=Sparassis crispa TaxID=139825 RepID=A0A401H4K3_9APHY|nr:hypothetical protein SCP_1600030 [Sparassis crispa]GBE89342.1 hypothetical protein SCP_1600030 [Sparassis crispa]